MRAATGEFLLWLCYVFISVFSKFSVLCFHQSVQERNLEERVILPLHFADGEFEEQQEGAWPEVTELMNGTDKSRMQTCWALGQLPFSTPFALLLN